MRTQYRPDDGLAHLCALLAGVTVCASTPVLAAAGGSYKVGDRVECEVTGTLPGKYWTKGTVMPFKDGDFGAGVAPDGSWFRVKADANRVEYPCKPEHLRPLTEPAATEKPAAGKSRSDAARAATDEAVVVASEFLECPVEQPPASNGATPPADLLKKLIRCHKGEKAVPEGDEGAVKVEVTAVQVGASRPWSYAQDSGSGKPGTVVFPVKATYTVKTLYRTATETEAGWIRILNVYVDSFGEWRIGSEEPVKSPKVSRVEAP